MDTSLSWIKAYVPELDCTAQEYTDAMTLSGTKVEGYTELDKNLETKHKGLYVIGDGSGVTHSLSHASASGVYVADQLCEKL